jgi:hypothetical protein
VRLGRATRGKWRIPDGKDESDMPRISLEVFACLEFMVFGSRQISLIERSCSSFCFLWFCFICVQVRIFLFLPATPTRAISGRSRTMMAGFPTGTHRCRLTEETHSLLGQRECTYHERHRFRKNSYIY